MAGRAGGAQSVGSTADRARAKFAGVTSKPWKCLRDFVDATCFTGVTCNWRPIALDRDQWINLVVEARNDLTPGSLSQRSKCYSA